MSSTAARPRHLANLRDLGGMPTEDGRKTVTGVLWRSDAPLVDDETEGPGGLPWPPGSAVDLRQARELHGEHPLVASGADVTAMPLFDSLAPDQHRREGGIPIDELYLLLLDSGAGWLPDLFAIAARGPAPVLLHCAAGKDRTGVACAVLLRAAGVTREAAAADFVATNDRRVALHARLVAQGALDADVDPSEVGVDPELIEAVLDRLEPDPWAVPRAAGVPDDDLRTWRDRLLGAA